MDYSKIGTQLKLIRERKGLSHHQVFEITRIQPYILKDIEEGTTNIAPVFLKSFIKTYCQFLGLDFEKLAQESIEPDQQKSESPIINSSKKISIGKQKKNIKNLFIYISPIFVFLVLFQIINSFKSSTNLSIKSPQDTISKASDPNPSEEGIIPQLELSVDKAKKPAVLYDSVLKQIKASIFNHEILIQSSQKLSIYFKTDNRFTINKELSPFIWFSIKAKESIYLRFDEKQGNIQIFYNGEQVDLGTNRFFEKKFE